MDDTPSNSNKAPNFLYNVQCHFRSSFAHLLHFVNDNFCCILLCTPFICLHPIFKHLS
uniref:Ovule protein n=1 Tax=Ascaris lumbricoides TaxID=6252 RepID=A0A0M3HIK9_ASCLU